MAKIINIEINREDTVGRGVVLTFATGETITLSFADAGIIKEQMLLEELRDGITNIVDDEIGDGYMDLDKYDGSREEFEDEIYVDLEDEISCGDYSALCNDGEWIREKVDDLITYYDLEPDEDEDEEDDDL